MGVSIFFVLTCHERDFGGHVSRMLQIPEMMVFGLEFQVCLKCSRQFVLSFSEDDTNSFAFNEAKQRDHISPLRPLHFIMGRLG